MAKTAKELNNTWRLTAATVYKKPVDSKIFGSVEIDVTDLNQYIAQKRNEGLKITLTHFFTLATGRAIAQVVPEFNTYVKRGKIYSHDSVDAAVSVLQSNGHLGSVKIKHADKLSFEGLVAAMNEEVRQSRQGNEKGGVALKNAVGSIPWPFRNWLYAFIKKAVIDWGIDLPFIGLNGSSFGSYVISNIGSLGLDTGYPALMPMANMGFVLILGGVKEKPWVVNGEIVPRTIISLGAAIDHRVADASHGGQVFKFLKKMVEQPSILEKPV